MDALHQGPNLIAVSQRLFSSSEVRKLSGQLVVFRTKDANDDLNGLHYKLLCADRVSEFELPHSKVAIDRNKHRVVRVVHLRRVLDRGNCQTLRLEMISE